MQRPAWLTYLAYAAPSLPLALLYAPVQTFVPAFYAKSVGLPLSTIGAIIATVRVIDVVLDPAIGIVCDRTESKFGRRKKWIGLSLLPLSLGIMLLFCPPPQAGFVYLIAALSVAYISWSCIQIPYSAWAGDVIVEYKARTRVAGFRETMTVFGILAVSAFPIVGSRFGGGIDRATMAWLAILTVTISVLAFSLTLILVPDPSANRKHEIHNQTPVLLRLRAIFHNKPFRLLSVGLLVSYTGFGTLNALALFYFSVVFGSDAYLGYYMLTAYLFTAAAIPIWVRLANLIGKGRSVALSASACALLFLIVFGLSDVEHPWLFFIGAAGIGVCIGGTATIPFSMVADASDYGSLRSGGDEGGLYYSMWLCMQKLGGAFGVGIALPLAAMLDFHATNPSLHDNAVLRGLCGGLPAAFLCVSAVLFWLYPLTERRHAIVRRRLTRATFLIKK